MHSDKWLKISLHPRENFSNFMGPFYNNLLFLQNKTHRLMVYISLPDEKDLLLAFYLAMEEYVARHVDEEDCFFMWQTQPSVIFGRNQLIENEVNQDYCRQHAIRMYRRKSGGGCVYSDMSNVMFSYVTKEENVNFAFNRYVNMVALVLCKLGVEAKVTGRNDILIDGRKVSGCAFYHLPERSIVHGTLLYDTNMRHMVGSITPSDEKLVSKGVQSVRQHIALLKDYVDISLDELKRFARQQLCDRELTLSPADVEQIEQIMRDEYLSDSFIYGKNPRASLTRRCRIEGVGELELRMELKNKGRQKIIGEVNLLGDFFVVGDLSGLLACLHGVAWEREAIAKALPDRVDNVVRHLQRDDLIKLLTP